MLRRRNGDPLTVTDGAGRWRAGVLAAGRAVEVTSPVIEVPAPAWPVTVAFAPAKGDRPEWTVQKLTELGVDRIVVLRTDRAVVRWEGERAVKQRERLGRIAREAVMQSRRARIPTVEGPVTVGDVSAGDDRVVTADLGGSPFPPWARTVLIGPEGGWSDDERTAAEHRVRLGPNVLRVETAALTAAVLLTQQRDDASHRHGECC